MTNIVLVVIDTARRKEIRDNNDLMPFLAEKGSEGTQIDNYYSVSPWTAPSHASIFSQELPSVHGVTTHSLMFEKENKLLKELKDEGYRTCGISENGLIDPSFGYDDFDTFHRYAGKPGSTWQETWKKGFADRKKKWAWFFKESIKQKDLSSLRSFFHHALEKFANISLLSEDYNPSYSDFTLKKAIDELEEDEDTFLFLNFMPVHAPYTFNEEQRQDHLEGVDRAEIERATRFDTFQDLLEEDFDLDDVLEIRKAAYRAALQYTDTLLEQLVSAAPEDTHFVVIGDHGELHGEHELFGARLVNHHFGTFRELLEVPCITFPDQIDLDPGAVYDNLDVHNLILSLAKGDIQEVQLGSDYTISEYYGKAGFNRQVGKDIPADHTDLYERTSFSITSGLWKLDRASDGKKLWNLQEETELTNHIDQKEELAEELNEILVTTRESNVIDLIDV